MGDRLDHAGLDQQPARGQDQAVADQDRRLDPGQHAGQPPQATVRGSRPDPYGEQRQERGDGLGCGRSHAASSAARCLACPGWLSEMPTVLSSHLPPTAQ